MNVSIYIKRYNNNKIVKTVKVQNASERKLKKVVSGILINLNTDDFYVDDDEAWQKLEDE